MIGLIVNDDLEEQIVTSESETQNQDNIALKLISVKNSLDHTNTELERVRNEKEDLKKQLSEMIFTLNMDDIDDNGVAAEVNNDAEDSIHKSVLNRRIEDCDQMIGKLNEKIEYLKFDDHNSEIEQ